MSAEALQRRVGYTFRNADLLQAALTHRSAGRKHNERLEFLGDSIVNFVVGAALYRAKPKFDEGQLTRQRAALVRRETLADIGRELPLAESLVLGPGEHCRESILADAVEALVGAIYLDSDFMAAQEVVLRIFASRLDNLPSAAALKDPKTQLQEHLQSKGLALPEYHLVSTSGKSHARQFCVRCDVLVLSQSTLGEGSSRRRAEQASASSMLEKLAQL